MTIRELIRSTHERVVSSFGSAPARHQRRVTVGFCGLLLALASLGGYAVTVSASSNASRWQQLFNRVKRSFQLNEHLTAQRLKAVNPAQGASSPSSPATSSGIVISQVYGGGGNSGAPYTNDFIELFNRGSSSVNVNGWSVQYAAAAGASWQVTNLPNVSIAPGKYLLIQESGGAAGSALPTPDTTDTISMSATAGKVALVNSTTALSGSCPSTGVIDLVGYGATATCFEGTAVAPAPSNTTADIRKNAGCAETDDNSADFAASMPTPRNSSSATHGCPAISALGVTRQAGSPSANATIANVSHATQTLATLAVTLNSSASATVTGVTVSNLAVSNAGAVTADVIAACSATTASFTLTVTDSISVTATAMFTVTVNADTAPTLSYSNWAVKPTGTLTFSPLQARDNGSIVMYEVQNTGGLPVSSIAVSPIGKITISNAPASGTYTPVIRATDNCGATTDASFTLNVFDCTLLSITPTTLLDGTVGASYPPSAQTLSGTTNAPYSFTQSAGALPPGLTLSTSGTLTGTPQLGGTYNFTIRIEDSNACVKHQAFSLFINGTGTCPQITLPPTIERAYISQSYSQSLAAQPSGSYTYNLTDGLADFTAGGFLFGASSGLLTHSNVTGPVRNIDIVVTATDAATCLGSAAYRLKIRDASAALGLLADYDDDGVADFVVWSAASGEWRIRQSQSGQAQTSRWGTQGDVPLLGDYDGDGKTDLAVFRPSNGTWYVKQSRTGAALVVPWGLSTDVPVPGDYDGDHQTDIAVWRPSDGRWYVLRSRDQRYEITQWGAGQAPFDDVPVAGDFDGDGRSDLAVFRRGTGGWFIWQSRTGTYQFGQLGSGTDTPVAADYDGDGKTDFAVWRASEGGWQILGSRDGVVKLQSWGAGYAPYYDVATPGDYDGDGQADLAVWRAADSMWYVLRSDTGAYLLQKLGQVGDRPVPVAQR